MKAKKILAWMLCAVLLGTMLPSFGFAESMDTDLTESMLDETVPPEVPVEAEELSGEADSTAPDPDSEAPAAEPDTVVAEEAEIVPSDVVISDADESSPEETLIPDETVDETLLPEETDAAEPPVQENDQDLPTPMETGGDVAVSEAEAEVPAELPSEPDTDGELTADLQQATAAEPSGGIAASGTWGGEDCIDWYLYENGFLDIVGHGKEMPGFSGNGIAKLAWQYYQKQITSLRIRGVPVIGSMAFSNCTNLKTVDLEEGLWKIDDWAFANCKLTQLTLPRSVTTLGDCPFKDCPFTTAGPIGSGCDFEYPWITEIPAHAFHNLTKLTRITLPENVSAIGASAFNGCESLPSIALPKSVKTIGAYAFSGCTNITEISIPDGVQVLDEYLFASCRGLQKVSIPNSVTTINRNAFNICIELKSIDIPDSVTSIGMYAFADCYQLQQFDIPSGVATIEKGTFSGCNALTELTIPVRVKTIDNYAFYNCDKLATVYYGGTEAQWNTITIASGNYPLNSANIIFGTSQPASISKTSMKLAAGKSDTLTLYYESGSAVTNATWSSSDESVAKVDGNGTVTAIKYGSATITGRSRGKGLSCSVNVLFSDVADETAYFYAPVYWAAASGITSGSSPSTFSPYNACTRAQVMAFLYKAKGSPAVSGSNPFIDVKESDYFYKPVLWAVSQGITNGTSATTFSPYNTCTRAQVMAFLYKASGSPTVNGENPFTDVKESDYFYNAVLWAVANGITNGTSTTTFSPYNTCTRAQVMTFLYKAIN